MMFLYIIIIIFILYDIKLNDFFFEFDSKIKPPVIREDVRYFYILNSSFYNWAWTPMRTSMTTIIERKGVVFSPTTVQIPLNLKIEAKGKGISLSATLKEALENKLKE